MTNIERINNMTAEEMALFLTDIATIEDCPQCPAKSVCGIGLCDSGFEHWLESEVQEDEN